MFRNTSGYTKTTPMRLQTAVEEYINGVLVKTFKDVEGVNGLVMCNFKSYGGTEKVSNDMLVVEDTAQIVCWYRPDITSGSRLKRTFDNAIYEVIGEPENLEMRNFEMQFKVRRVKGGA